MPSTKPSRTHAEVEAAELPVVLSKWFDFIGDGDEDRAKALVRHVETAAALMPPPRPVRTRHLKAV